GQRRALESLDQNDVGAIEIATRQRNRIGFLAGALEQDPLARRFHQHALGFALMPVAPGVLALLIHVCRMRAVLQRHHAELAAHELGGERDEKRRLAGVLEPDDGNHPRRCHSASARARSSGVFTLKNSSSGSPNRRTSASGTIPTRTSGWKEIAMRSPWSSRLAMAGAQAGP